MTKPDPIDRRLRLALSTSWAPDAARARVREKLVASGALAATGGTAATSAAKIVNDETLASPTSTAGVAKLTTALLVGFGFIAGYLLGVQSSAGPHETNKPFDPSALHDGMPRAPALHETAPDRPEASPAHPGAALDAGDPVTPARPAAPTPAFTRAAPRSRVTPARALAPDLARASARGARLARGAAPADPAGEELVLLARAERAIRASEPALALTFLDDLERRFPTSSMIEERRAARLLAGCALSNPGARRRAELFIEERAASVYTDRVRRSCGLEPPHLTEAPSQATPRATPKPPSRQDRTPLLAPPAPAAPSALDHPPAPADGSSRGGH